MKNTILNLIKKGYSVGFSPDDFDNSLITISLRRRVKGEDFCHRVRISMEAIDLAYADLIEITLKEQEKKIDEALQKV